MGERIVSAAEALVADMAAAARDLAFDVAIVCVDKGGHIVAARRSDGAGYPSLEMARRKAVTSAVLGVPTAMVAAMTASDTIAANAIAAAPDMLAVPGGAPLVVDAITVGGIGVAGGHYSEDQMILERGLEAAAAKRVESEA